MHDRWEVVPPLCADCGRDATQGRAGSADHAGASYCKDCWDLWETAPGRRPPRRCPWSPPLTVGDAADELPGVAVLCINLDRRQDRLRRTLALLRQTGPALLRRLHRVPAVDGAATDLLRLPRWLLEAQTVPFQDTGLIVHAGGVQLPPGAVGCALSHFRVWEAVAAAGRAGPGLRCALVLEDDLVAAEPGLCGRLAGVLRQLPDDWDLCFLGYHTDRTIQLGALQRLCRRGGDGGPREEVRVEELKSGVCGTFAYLLSPKGAERLLEEGMVFPLSGQRQLDAAMSQAFERLSVWAAPQAQALIYSPQSQAMTTESDVQFRYYGPLEREWRAYNEAVLDCISRLDVDTMAGSQEVAVLPAPRDEIAGALRLEPRRCVCVDFVDPGGAQRDAAVAGMRATICSLRAADGAGRGDVPVVVVWYGEDQHAAARARSLLPECAFVVRGPYPAEANRLSPGVGTWLEARGPILHGFVSLQAFNLVELDQLLYLASGEELPAGPGGGLSALFGAHADAEVYGRPAGPIAGAPEVLKALGARAEGGPRACGLRALLYNRRSWVKASYWAGEMLQLWLRLHADLPCPEPASEGERELLAAHCAVTLSGLALESFRGDASAFGPQSSAEPSRSEPRLGVACAALPEELAACTRDDGPSGAVLLASDWVAVD